MSQLETLDKCTNCGANLPNREAYCPYCGQRNINRKVSIWTFFREFLGEYTKLDAKLFRSLQYLLMRPGKLTLEFWEGKRNSFIKPARLFLLLGVFAFITLNWLIDAHPEVGTFISFTPSKDYNVTVPENLFEAHYLENMRLADENPSGLVKKILGQIPLVLLMLLPLFALLLKLFFRKHSRFLVEHFVHLLHLHSFLFFTIILLSGIALTVFFSVSLTLIGFLVNAAYIFISMRRVYPENGWLFGIKFFLLSVLYWIIVPGGSILVGLLISLFLS